MTVFDSFRFLTEVLISTSILVGIILFYRYMMMQRMGANREKRKYTLELCLSDKRVYENILSKKRVPYYKQIENTEKTIALDEVNEALAYFEKISIGMTTKIYDEHVIRMYYGKYFLMFYDFYKYYIMKYREQIDLPFLYIEFEKCAKRWHQESETYANDRRFKDEW